MGMYTGFRMRAKIKPEYRDMVIQLCDRRYQHAKWSDFDNEVAREWCKVGRCDFIPYGVINYVNWNEHDPAWRDGFKDGVWQFQCSLKNYNGEIEQFLHTVVDKIAEEVYVCESQYETAAEPTDLIPELRLTQPERIFDAPILTPEVLSGLK